METELTIKMSKEELRDKIVQLESVMKSMPNQIHIEPVHYFAPGIYSREITIPEGATVVGKIHKTEHLCVLAKGHLSVRTENGIEEIRAPAVIHSMPGMKRVLHAHEESVWINFHHNPTNEKDVEKIENLFVVNTFEELGFSEPKQLKEGE